jgi:beta-glucosidase-like glycosyl hydrolase/CubicO group peptidase (beta-lactamase class C family)
MRIKIGFATICFLLVLAYLPAQRGYRGDLSQTNTAERAWVDSVFQALSPDERLGQLFMIRAHSNLGSDHVAKVESLIRNHHVGGLCFFQGTPEMQVKLTNRYQQLSRIPLLISMDAEWGLQMRLKESTIGFPKQLALGAIQDNRLIYDMGTEIARQMNRIGVHVSFSPVLDINNNPDNPVIGPRSFGESRYLVTAKSYQYMRGLQDHNVMACAKHFPGHGDTDVDSHYDLPVIPFDRNRLDSVELYPFRVLAQKDIGSFMVAHLSVPELDNRPNRPTTLSRNTVTGLLRQELNFDGLIYTDALDMKGVTKHFGAGEVAAEALVAGNDVLLVPEDVPACIAAIKRYVAEGRLDPRQVDASVKRILRAKYRLGLTEFYPIPVNEVRKDLNTPAARELRQQLFENALTLVRDPEKLVPVATLADTKLASLSIGAGTAKTPFQERLLDYAKVLNLEASASLTRTEHEDLLRRLGDMDAVFVSFHSSGSSFLEKIDPSPSVVKFLQALQERTAVIVSIFGNPYALADLEAIKTVLVAYTNDPTAQDVAAQALFGAVTLSGRLPVSVSPRAQLNQGEYRRANFRMGYAPPERVGLYSDTLAHYIDAHMQEAIDRRATPGGVVLVARQGRIVFERAYGHHTYARKQPVRTNDLYDLASITKIAATTLAVMKLYEDGLIDLDEPVGTYLPELRGTNKNPLTIREIMAHRSGLAAWIPFYTETLSGSRRYKRPSPEFYRPTLAGDFVVPVTDRLFMKSSYVDSIWARIAESELRTVGRYRYSDLGFYLLARLVRKVAGEPLDQYVDRVFYRPLGLHELTFLPLKRFPLQRIVPTENDQYFRFQVVHGYVHDMGAAMLGGVSGHAGLFGTARDLAVLMQLLLQGGTYGGQVYLQPATVREFTRRFEGDSRRGLGFDMKQLNPDRSRNMSGLASERTFGHQGFTGTVVWADPQEDLVFVFLSNRTYPSMRNYRLNTLSTRTRIHSVLYEAINPAFDVHDMARRLTPGVQYARG